MMITLLIAFAVGIVLGKVMLPVLHKLKFGQNIYELAPEAHKKKQGTPTMGGLVIAGAAIAAALVMNDYSVPMGQNMLLAMLLMALGNLCIGFVDDMTKIRKGTPVIPALWEADAPFRCSGCRRRGSSPFRCASQ